VLVLLLVFVTGQQELKTSSEYQPQAQQQQQLGELTWVHGSG
jgi:hypothetical protein